MYPQEERTRIGDLRCRRGFKAGSTNWGVIHPWVAVKTTGVERTTQKEDEVQEKRVRGRALENPDIEGPHRRHESKRRGVYSSVQSVQFSFSVMSNSLWPHGLQHTRLPCPSPTPAAYSNSCPLHWWCHPTVSSSVTPFFSCLQSFLVSASFPMSRFFALGGQSIGVLASASVSNEHPGLISFRMDWLDLLAVQGTLKSLIQHHSSKASILWRSAFFIVQLSHPYMTTGKTIILTRQTFVGKVVSAF